MPIYEYRCADCGYQKEYLQKVSDPQMTVCPSCNKVTFAKMLTAAGFQLKGSGWYATDFKSGTKAKPAETKAETKDGANAESGSKAESKTEAKIEAKPETKTETKSESGSRTAAPAAG